MHLQSPGIIAILPVLNIPMKTNARDTRYNKNVACDKLDENRMKIVPCVIPSDFCRMELDGIELNQGSGSVLV